MVFFTLWATIDSVILFCAMFGLVASNAWSLKLLVDLEYDIIKPKEFFAKFPRAQYIELASLTLNLIAILPLLVSWWLAPFQVVWVVIRASRAIRGSHVIHEQDIYRRRFFKRQRRWLVPGFLFYIFSIWVYYARTLTAVINLHVHGISPYD
eukprot:TRINITY_DN5714_c0_g2_i1.p1 TRINITY_DN5714_c0_g2~~TRINITY_DN5714_c0_g2_i1.p1  ORF type:complete len:152 (+),score=9.33 TRINITY_DN5714_c0_g2_i1:13-468(+)